MPGYSIVIEHNGQKIHHWRPTLQKAEELAIELQPKNGHSSPSEPHGIEGLWDAIRARLIYGLSLLEAEIDLVEMGKPVLKKEDSERGVWMGNNGFAALDWWERFKGASGVSDRKGFEKLAGFVRGALALADEAERKMEEEEK